MPNPIKYSTGSESLALKKGNFYIGTGDVGKGPTNSTGYYNGISPPTGGYTIYLNKETGGPSIYTVTNDTQLISLTNSIAGQSYTTVNECLVYFAGQTDKVVLNRDYEGIVTDGLVLNLDGGFTPSYPRSGTTWSDVSLSGNNGTLTNGPTFNSDNGGSIVFDGMDDYVNTNAVTLTTSSFSCESFFQWYTVGNNRGVLHSLSYNYPNTGYLIRQADTNDNKIVVWSDNGTETFVLSTATIPINTWKHLVVVQNTNNCSIYINGVLDSSQSLSNPVINITYPYRIGQRGSTGAYLSGRIAVNRIYNRALSATEILQNYNAQKGRFGL
jgi:hypothetical protein